MKKILNKCVNVLVSIVVILAFLVVGVKFLGVDVLIVLSGSMEPKYPTGSIIYVNEVDVNELEKSDVISYQLTNNIIATHRIEEVIDVEGQLAFITKGDANDFVDNGYVLASEVIGSPFFTIPYLGFVVNYVQQPPGMYIAIAFAIALGSLMMLLEINKDEEKK